MSGVRIYVANSATASSSLVLDGKILDLFDDESIMLTLKQTDIRDIAVNYSTYSQDFTIPASASNNKILKYWYDIKNDSQQTNSIPSRIDIDGVFFKYGVINILSYQSNGSGAGKNKFYTIQFTSSLKSLKDTFGNTLIGALKYDSIMSSTIDFTDTYVRNSITSTSLNQDIEIPLIPISRNLTTYNEVRFTGSNNTFGIKRSELRPAIKFRKIIEVIQSRFNIILSGGFITGSTLDNLYLWLNKNDNIYQSGGNLLDISNASGSGVTASSFMSYNSAGDYISVISSNNNSYQGNSLEINTNVSVTGTASYMCKIQEVKLNDNGTINEENTKAQFLNGIVSQSVYKTGNQNNMVRFTYEAKDYPNGTKRSFRFIGETDKYDVVTINSGAIIVTNIIKLGNGYTQFLSSVVNFTTTTLLQNKVGISENLPDLTVQDFITSIIKMYNLIIVPDDNNTNIYNLETFTSYYGKGANLNITKYCTTSKKLNKVKTYKKLSFKHSDSTYGSNIAFKKNQFPIREYGEISTTVTSSNDTDEYKVETKFNLLRFKELTTIGFTASSYGLNNTWITADATGEDAKSIISNKPTIFYYNGKSSIIEGKFISYTLDNGTSQSLSSYSQFSNIDSLTSSTTTLCFSSENMFDKGVYEQNLYSNGYKSLVSQIYSPYVREFEIQAYLPKFIYTTISLNNLITIGNENFTITDITLNLLTGKANLKLNNVVYL